MPRIIPSNLFTKISAVVLESNMRASNCPSKSSCTVLRPDWSENYFFNIIQVRHFFLIYDVKILGNVFTLSHVSCIHIEGRTISEDYDDRSSFSHSGVGVE